MNLPFTKDAFFEIFASYNNAIFPIQYFLIIVALLPIFIIFKRLNRYYFVVPVTLSFLWAWMGVVYHIVFFSQINPVAILFGAGFIMESALFIYAGFIKKHLSFSNPTVGNLYMSLAFFIYAFLIYPIITIKTGHPYPSLPTFGLPCPTTIYTFGIFLLTDLKKLPMYLLVIPTLWVLIGSTATLKFGVLADAMLFISFLVFLGTIYFKRKSSL